MIWLAAFLIWIVAFSIWAWRTIRKAPVMQEIPKRPAPSEYLKHELARVIESIDRERIQ